MVLSTQTTADINNLSTDAVFLHLLEISMPNQASVYIVNNTENITWNGNEYLMFPFDFEDLSESSTASVPQWTMRISNVNRVMERHLQEYDRYLKLNGIEGNEITCTIRLVNSKELENTEPITEYESVLSQPSTDARFATFKLSAKSPYNHNFPTRKILKNFCGFKFKGLICKYNGDAEFCDKTLVNCRTYGNSHRFGGFISASGSGITLVN
jgi:lambda family phage minor tail protein L